MPNATTNSRDSNLFFAIFGPHRWYAKAAKVLNVHEQTIYKLARGQHQMRRRYVVTIRNYLANRRNAIATETKTAKARLDREEKRARSVLAQADLRLVALEAEMRRTAR